MATALFVHALEVGVAQETRGTREAALLASRINNCVQVSLGSGGAQDSCFFQIGGPACGNADEGVRATPAIRGNLVSPRPACAPWRGGGKELSGRPGSSCACEIHVSWIACAGWVGKYA